MNDFQRFLILKDKWKEQVKLLSDSSRIHNDPHYKEIVRMGNKVLPFILQEIYFSKDHWFEAMVQITGDNPVNTKDTGDTRKIRDSWIEWAEKRGISFSQEAMDIHTPKGQKVRFAFPNAGYKMDSDLAKNFLIPGEVYTVEETYVGDWRTEVLLKEVENYTFNSVLFENVKP